MSPVLPFSATSEPESELPSHLVAELSLILGSALAAEYERRAAVRSERSSRSPNHLRLVAADPLVAGDPLEDR